MGLPGDIDVAPAEEEVLGEFSVVFAVAAGPEPVDGLVLVELSGSVIPGSCWLAGERSGAEGGGDAGWGLAADLPAADLAVFVEPVVDVGEAGPECRALPVELMGDLDSALEVAEAVGQGVDGAGVAADLFGDLLEGAMGGGDGVLVASAAEGPVVSGEDVSRLLKPGSGPVETDGGLPVLLSQLAELAGELVQVDA